MKILVTGAAGFIGSHLSELLRVKGHEVVGLDSFEDYYSVELKELNAKDLKESGIEILKLNLAEDNLDVVKDFDFVFHLAAQPGISATTSFEDYEKNNIVATHRLLEAAKNSEKLKLFVNIATSSVYGAQATEGEDSAPKPTSFYGVTKLAAEQLVMAYNRDQDFPACSFRLFSVYGPRERPEKFFVKLIKSIFEDSEITVFEGSEMHERSFSYVGDIAEGLSLAINNIDKCVGEIFNLGSDKSFTTGEAMQIIEEVIGKKAKKKILPPRPGDQEKTHANIDKIKKVLCFEPKTTLKEGLAKEVEWYKNSLLPLS